MKNIYLYISAFLLIMLSMNACKKNGNTAGDSNVVNGFDKAVMVTNYADNIILPSYNAMQQKVAALQTASDAFLANPATATQATLKAAYMDAYLQYEEIAAFQFGPAETSLLDIYLNYSGGLDYDFTTSGQLTGFSIDTASIENNISSGVYDLTGMSRSNLYSQGFPALDYLFFSPNAIGKYNVNTASRVRYTKDVVGRIKTLVDKVIVDWAAYRAGFITNTKTNVGSPIGNIVNQLAFQLDLLKGPRLGWPFGKQSNGTVFATKCEGYYAGISVTLAVKNLSSLKRFYTAGGTGKGIADYLVALKKADLNNDVLAQFDLAITKLQAIPDPLSSSLTTQPVVVDAAYKEIQKLLTLLKTDVASATAVQITFMDNDGD